MSDSGSGVSIDLKYLRYLGGMVKPKLLQRQIFTLVDSVAEAVVMLENRDAEADAAILRLQAERQNAVSQAEGLASEVVYWKGQHATLTDLVSKYEADAVSASKPRKARAR